MSEPSELTVLFVDVSGSTRLYESAGDHVAHAAIEQCIELLKQKTVANNGRVIKTIGDEVMSVFPEASSAADAAVQMQEAIDALPPVAGSPLGVRIGLHHGPVVAQDGDVFGDTVNVAARLAGIAAKGQIMTSLATVAVMTESQRAATRRLYSIQVKGKEQEVKLYEVLWKVSDDLTMQSQSFTVKNRQTSLRLRYLDRDVLLDGSKSSIVLGRDKNADVPVIDKMASRMHGKIECRLGRFVFSDHSANSTYITIDGEQEVQLRREDLVLRGHGIISFGQPRASASEVAEFFCE
ncbi:MAG: adenylate/guanylate cyclase domain-containing protein [Ramlibacter sp.]